MSFAGKRVVAFESRRAAETAELIRRHQGDPFVAPALREVPVEENAEAFQFADRLFAGEFDMVVFLTGVGTKYLARVVESRFPPEAFPEALRKVTVVARGPKPVAALREMKVPVHITVPEPNTWAELLEATKDRPERRIAVQLYGRSSPELIEGLRARGVEVTPVPVYQYGMPEDVGPLREAASRLAQDGFEVTLFTTSQQVHHLMTMGQEMGNEDRVREGLRHSVIGSIGPTTSEALRENGLEPDLEPSHPKLGLLVKETAEQAEEILSNRKRVYGRQPPTH
jgi:uroporphyrinogen-III synthase